MRVRIDTPPDNCEPHRAGTSGTDSGTCVLAARRCLLAACLLAFRLLLCGACAVASESESATARRTLGGRQFWTDHLVHHDWRIQQHILTGHYRLLDQRDQRRAAGSFEACRSTFYSLQRELQLPPLGDRVVIVLHGLGRSRQSMTGIVNYLRKNTDYTVLNVSYASTRGRIGRHAKGLALVVEHLPAQVRQVDFVAHSMGNLVIRHYFADLAIERLRPQQSGRIGRTVMLAPPNQGASLAERFETNPVFRFFWGTSGGEIADWETLAPRLAIPPGEFGILAGARGDAAGRNPLIRGDDDFVLAVSETRLGGASDFLALPALHAVIMDSAQVQRATLRFLRHGYFHGPHSRQPIEPE